MLLYTGFQCLPPVYSRITGSDFWPDLRFLPARPYQGQRSLRPSHTRLPEAPVDVYKRQDMRYSAVPSEYIRGYLFYIILASVILVSSYTIAKLYRSVWTYAGIPEVLRTFVTAGIAAAITGVTYTISVIRMPISFYLVGWGLVFAPVSYTHLDVYKRQTRGLIYTNYIKNERITRKSAFF